MDDKETIPTQRNELYRLTRRELAHHATSFYNSPIHSAAFSPKDKLIHDHGLISILKQLHDELDAAVFDAYNWPQNLTDEQLLQNLVSLNHQRAAEEKQGKIKYLRPDFQKK